MPRKSIVKMGVYKKSLRLSDLKQGQKAIISGFDFVSEEVMFNRLLDLGFTQGTSVEFVNPSPMGNPKAYLIRNTTIALRDDQAQHILVNIHNEL